MEHIMKPGDRFAQAQTTLSTAFVALVQGFEDKRWHSAPMVASSGQPRFLTLADVAEVLNTSQAQVYALVRRGELRAIKIGGRGQWRVETTELEAFIERMYAQTDAETGWSHSESSQGAEVPEGQHVDDPVVP